MPESISHEELRLRFTYHPPKDQDQLNRYDQIRKAGLVFAELICQLTPGSGEQSLAITDIENAVMHANAAIARREVDV